VEEHELLDAVSARLRTLGAREWQVGLTIDVLTRAIVDAPAKVATEAEPLDGTESTGS